MSRRAAWTGLGVLLLGLGASTWWARARQRASEDDRAARQDAAWRAAATAFERRLAEPVGPPVSAPEVDGGRLRRDVESLAFVRFTAAERTRARAYISHALTAMGYAPELHAFGEGVNVLTERAGTDITAPAILVAAHFDTVAESPGADDNATGVAAALEVARLYARRPTRRTLRLAFFDLEEAGLRGSAAYVRSSARTDDLGAVLVLEMLGVQCRSPGCQQVPEGLPRTPPSDRGDFLLALGSAEPLELLLALARAERPGLPRIFALPVVARGLPWPGTRRSDHAPFWDAGVPAAMLTDTAELRSAWYHTAFDDPSQVDFEFLRGSAQLAVNALEVLLQSTGGDRPAGSSR